MKRPTILQISLISTLSALIQSAAPPEPSYQTCGKALHQRLDRVCKGDPGGNNTRSLISAKTSINSTPDYGSQGSPQQFLSLLADCCTRTQGCSDGWIRQRYCPQSERSQRDAEYDYFDSLTSYAWNDIPLTQEQYDCYQTDTIYVNWWSTSRRETIRTSFAVVPKDCQDHCRTEPRCKYFTWSQLRRTLTGDENYMCWLRSTTGGGAMHWMNTVSGPPDCAAQAEFAANAPIDTCIEFANQNSDFLRKPKDYPLPSMIKFNPRLTDPNQLNLLTIKLKINTRFTLYIGPKVSSDYSSPVLTEDPDPAKMFKNVFSIKTHYAQTGSFVVVNQMTDGQWSDEEFRLYFDSDYENVKNSLDEIVIRLAYTKITVYIHGIFSRTKKRYINFNVINRPEWFNSVENIWFSGDSGTKVFNFFHCTSGRAQQWNGPISNAYLFDVKKWSISANIGFNYLAFYGQVIGSRSGSFQIQFQTSGAPNYDTLLTFSVSFQENNEHISMNSKLNGLYNEETKYYDFPFDKDVYGNNNFTRLDFMFRDHQVNVAINGFKYHAFRYRRFFHKNLLNVYITSPGAEAAPGTEILFVIYGIDAKYIDNPYNLEVE